VVALAGLAGAVVYTVGGPSKPIGDGAGHAIAGLAASAAMQPASTASAAASTAALASADLASGFGNEADAWRALAPAWKLELGEGDPCTLAREQQVQCFRSSGGNLATIRQLARPGIIGLQAGDAALSYALLTGLTDHSATLRLGAASRTVSLASLARWWRGDFATFWRVPPGFADHLVDDESDPSAAWLSERLATLQGPAARDEKLKARVSAFQLAQGLKADGLAGPTTFMQLNRALGIDEPRLSNAN
jgi:general secretion pathway protein A